MTTILQILEQFKSQKGFTLTLEEKEYFELINNYLGNIISVKDRDLPAEFQKILKGKPYNGFHLSEKLYHKLSQIFEFEKIENKTIKKKMDYKNKIAYFLYNNVYIHQNKRNETAKKGLISKRADRSLLVGKMSNFNKQNNFRKTSEKWGIFGNESRKTNLLLGKDEGIPSTSKASKRNEECCRISGQRRLCTREFSKTKLFKTENNNNCKKLLVKNKNFGLWKSKLNTEYLQKTELFKPDVLEEFEKKKMSLLNKTRTPILQNLILKKENDNTINKSLAKNVWVKKTPCFGKLLNSNKNVILTTNRAKVKPIKINPLFIAKKNFESDKQFRKGCFEKKKSGLEEINNSCFGLFFGKLERIHDRKYEVAGLKKKGLVIKQNERECGSMGRLLRNSGPLGVLGRVLGLESGKRSGKELNEYYEDERSTLLGSSSIRNKNMNKTVKKTGIKSL